MADLVGAWERAKAAGDAEAMATAALALAANPTFGGVPGGVPALLFEARSRAEGAARTRLAAALARAWAYAGQPARAAGSAAEAQADVEAIEHALGAGIALQSGDTAALATEARGFEGYGLAEGIRSIAAWAAVFWVGAGEPERARAVLHQLDDFAAIPHDVDWLLTVYLLTDVAAAIGEPAQAEAGLALLTPYAGRGVIDAGGVAFAGVVDAVLARACALLDRPADAARWASSAAAGYRRIGATWLLTTLPTAAAPGAAHPEPGGQPSPTAHRGATPTTSHAPTGEPAPATDPAPTPTPAHPEPTGGLGRTDTRPRPTSWPAGQAEPRVLHLRPDGDGIWWVGSDDRPFAVRDMRGLRYLHLLLSRPGLDVPRSRCPTRWRATSSGGRRTRTRAR